VASDEAVAPVVVTVQPRRAGPVSGLVGAYHRLITDSRWGPFAAPVLAGGLAFIASQLGWRGMDLPAQIYRVGLFHRQGLTLWDSGWYGGHWTLDYSVVFPPIAGIIGLEATTALSAAAASAAFDRIVVGHFGRAARVGSLIFALGTLVQVSIGQLPFLLGAAFALWGYRCASRSKWVWAIALAMLSALASPLAGAFLALGSVTLMIARWPRQRAGLAGVAAAVAVPVLTVAALFPGQGPFPFPTPDFALEAALCVGAWFVVPRRERGLWIGARLYALAMAVSFVLPSPLGGNIGRLGECIAIPLAVCVLWPLRRALLAAVVLPLVLMQWTPAWGAITTNGRLPSTHSWYYDPLLDFLRAHNTPAGRVEVVPTHLHWEAAYVAPYAPLARGWERQLDTADDPLFYQRGPIDPTAYLSWLMDNGVTYVALPDAEPDFASVEEVAVLNAGVAGLRAVWHDPHWTVFEVSGSPGIASGTAELKSINGTRLDLTATGAGAALVRVRYSPRWSVISGPACIEPSTDGWMSLRTSAPGAVHLRLRLTGRTTGACR
jgi:hypothetical protein